MESKELEEKVKRLEKEVHDLKKDKKISEIIKEYDENGLIILPCPCGGNHNWKEERVVGNIGIRHFKYCLKCKTQYPGNI